MSQLILDEQLAASEVLAPLRKWFRVQRLQDARPHERILDDRIPEILLTLKQPSFVTIDRHFWQRRLCNPNYCILYFALPDEDQDLLPGLLRKLLRHPAFRTRASRMGKVARVKPTHVEYWQFRVRHLHRVVIPKGGRKRS